MKSERCKSNQRKEKQNKHNMKWRYNSMNAVGRIHLLDSTAQIYITFMVSFQLAFSS